MFIALSPIAQASGVGTYHGPIASLALDFLTPANFDSRITFARADAVTCATYFDRTGRMQTAAANVARFDYDPATPAGVTGGELFANGGFDSDTAWTKSAGWSISGGSAIATNASATSLFQNVLTVGKTYRITFTVVSISSGGFIPFLGGGSLGTPVTVPGTYTYTAICTSNGNSGLSTSASTNGVVDSLSVQEVTFTPRGLLIEESRQNLLLQSRDMTQAAWTKTDVTPARTQVGIDGVANTACLMTEGSAGTADTSGIGAAMTAGSTVTGSVVLKRGNTDWIRVRVLDNATGVDGVNAWVNLATGAKGTVTALGSGTNAASTIQNLGGGSYRFSVTCTPSGTAVAARLHIMSASADNSTTRVSGATYIVDCAQLEVGAFATSIIPTTTTALTRAADSASMTGTNFSSWFNASAGTFVAEFDSVTTGSVATRVWQASSSGSEATFMRLEGTASGYSGNSSTADWTLSYSAGRVGTFKSAVAYAANDCALSFGGVLTATDSTTTLPASLAVLGLGGTLYVANRELNGHIRSLRYYPVRLGNSTLQALTA